MLFFLKHLNKTWIMRKEERIMKVGIGYQNERNALLSGKKLAESAMTYMAISTDRISSWLFVAVGLILRIFFKGCDLLWGNTRRSLADQRLASSPMRMCLMKAGRLALSSFNLIQSTSKSQQSGIWITMRDRPANNSQRR